MGDMAEIFNEWKEYKKERRQRLGVYAQFGDDWVGFTEDLETFAKLVAEHEREACARLAEEYANGLERNYSEIIADNIRARGKE